MTNEILKKLVIINLRNGSKGSIIVARTRTTFVKIIVFSFCANTYSVTINFLIIIGI